MLRRSLIHGNQSPIIWVSLKIMLYQKIGFAESFGITSPTARNDASARFCEAWNKPKQSLVGSNEIIRIRFKPCPTKNIYFITCIQPLHFTPEGDSSK
jgi:hypothetical protein